MDFEGALEQGLDSLVRTVKRVCADDSVPFAHAKAGYRQAICKRNPGLERAPGFLLLALVLLLAACAGVLVHEVRSPYSHIQVVDYGELRALRFAGESPIDVVETLVDRRAAHRLQHRYAQAMMAGLAYRPDPSSVLLIGLGGGALVHALTHHFPSVRLDVVEIDPEIVAVARQYFAVPPGPGTRIFVADGHEYLARSTERYDLILMNAHLTPSTLTDSTGHPLTMKTAEFYARVRERLNPDGLVLFNMLAGEDEKRFGASVRAAFAATEVFRPPGTLNVIVLASPAKLPDEALLRARARALDQRADFGFSFEQVLDWRSR